MRVQRSAGKPGTVPFEFNNGNETVKNGSETTVPMTPLWKEPMKVNPCKCLLAVLVITAFAGCMVPPQNRSASAARSDASLSSADWTKVTENDRASVRAGQLPKEVIQYDLQIEKMIPEGQEILASHDQARARVWTKKMNAIVEARNKVTEQFTAKAMARNNAIANAFGNGKPDPCLSPMGKNTCAAASGQQGDSVHYSVGPGGIGATVGHYTVGPGGIGATGF
ncbi:hypothetical protein [Paraburkholderia aspalathi]|uniref:Uncharacterized protein n=1 Tax=Paraburkholderia aspalathi TaxID=1324617 RepID=A0A1I7A846_9BURK|nr:hypothetical protein [Paraburkholderia aspalathi]SFT71115.1 hypothetical protein SAMN05192563_1003161 [Paraburkholderia aspalathi]